MPEPVSKTAAMEALKGLKSMSALIDEQGHDKRAVVVRFDHDVTDIDRAALLMAVNALAQSPDVGAEVHAAILALHAIDVEAANTIPRDGKEAAFAALERISKIIDRFRTNRPYPKPATPSMDTEMAATSHEPGMGWKLSDEARQTIDDTARANVRNAAAAGDSVMGATFPSFQVPTEPSPIKSPHSEGVFPKPDTVRVGREDLHAMINAALIEVAWAESNSHLGKLTQVRSTLTRLQSALGDA